VTILHPYNLIIWQHLLNERLRETLMNWVRLNKYCELSGDTVDGVKSRRKKGVWCDGIHCKIGPDGKLWINIKKVEEWVTNYRKE